MNIIVTLLIKIDSIITKQFSLTAILPKKVDLNKNVIYSQLGYRIDFTEKLEFFIGRKNCSNQAKNAVLKSISPVIGKGVEIFLKEE